MAGKGDRGDAKRRQSLMSDIRETRTIWKTRRTDRKRPVRFPPQTRHCRGGDTLRRDHPNPAAMLYSAALDAAMYPGDTPYQNAQSLPLLRIIPHPDCRHSFSGAHHRNEHAATLCPLPHWLSYYRGGDGRSMRLD